MSTSAPRPEVLAFLQAIKACPDDDTPRLVLADWLEENDDSRGGLIRLQCLHQATSTLDFQHSRYRQLLEEWTEAHQEEWDQLIPEPIASFTQHHRGLLKLQSSRLPDVPPDAWKDSEILHWIESWKLRAATHDLSNITAHAWYPHVTEIDIRLASNLNLDQLTAQQPLEKRLDLALLTGQHWPELDQSRLADWEGLRDVHTLRFQEVHDRPLNLILSSPHLQNLRELDFSLNNTTNKDLLTIAKKKCLQPVESLRIRPSNEVSLQPQTSGLRALFASNHLRSLRRLDLPDVIPSDKEALLLARSPALSSIERLDLSRNVPDSRPDRICKQGARALADSPFVGSLKELYLQNHEIGDAGAVALAQSKTLEQLTTLNLANNTIHVEGLKALLTADLPSLRYLNLAGNKIEGYLLFDIESWNAKGQLTTLNLSSMELGDEGVEYLARSAALESLTTLILNQNWIRGRAANRLLKSRYLEKLRRIQLEGNLIDELSQEKLRDRHGDRVEIIF